MSEQPPFYPPPPSGEASTPQQQQTFYNETETPTAPPRPDDESYPPRPDDGSYPPYPPGPPGSHPSPQFPADQPAPPHTHYPPGPTQQAPPPDQQEQAFPTYNPYIVNPVDQQKKYSPTRARTNRYSGEHDVTSPIHYTRDPKKLVAYLVPFPKPQIPNVPPEEIPARFLIYTPPPPPFVAKPAEGEKEGKVHKVQRKWQDEIREAKTGNAKTMSWKGVKGKAIRGINWGMGQTKSANLEFLNRIEVGGQEPKQDKHAEDKQAEDKHVEDKHAEDGVVEEDQTKATVKLEEMLLVYPSSMESTPEQMREEFVNTMLRSKTKAQRDAIIATSLLPVSAAIDVALTLVAWPFGGLLEIDAVWAYASIRGAKTSRSVTKRLTSTSTSEGSEGGNPDEDKLQLNFTPSPRMAVLEQYLSSRCHDKDANLFPSVGPSPSEAEVLEAIGWMPSVKGGAETNWEDEKWEISEVSDDLKSVMAKGAKEWYKWCKLFEKQPAKALKK